MRAYHKSTRHPWCLYLTREELERFLSGDPEMVERMKQAFLRQREREKKL